MPIRFKNAARQNGAIHGYKWSQNRWLAERTRRRGFGDQFGMDEGSCYMFSAEWLAMASKGLTDTFNLHMSLPTVHDKMQALKIAQKAGQAQQITAYLRTHGLNPVATRIYTFPAAYELAQDVTEYSGYYIVGISNLRSIMANGSPRSGHAIAVRISPRPAVFDPNYGMAMFRNSDDLCGFIIELLANGYSRLKGHAVIWKYR